MAAELQHLLAQHQLQQQLQQAQQQQLVVQQAAAQQAGATSHTAVLQQLLAGGQQHASVAGAAPDQGLKAIEQLAAYQSYLAQLQQQQQQPQQLLAQHQYLQLQQPPAPQFPTPTAAQMPPQMPPQLPSQFPASLTTNQLSQQLSQQLAQQAPAVPQARGLSITTGTQLQDAQTMPHQSTGGPFFSFDSPAASLRPADSAQNPETATAASAGPFFSFDAPVESLTPDQPVKKSAGEQAVAGSQGFTQQDVHGGAQQAAANAAPAPVAPAPVVKLGEVQVAKDVQRGNAEGGWVSIQHRKPSRSRSHSHSRSRRPRKDRSSSSSASSRRRRRRSRSRSNSVPRGQHERRQDQARAGSIRESLGHRERQDNGAAPTAQAQVSVAFKAPETRRKSLAETPPAIQNSVSILDQFEQQKQQAQEAQKHVERQFSAQELIEMNKNPPTEKEPQAPQQQQQQQQLPKHLQNMLHQQETQKHQKKQEQEQLQQESLERRLRQLQGGPQQAGMGPTPSVPSGMGMSRPMSSPYHQQGGMAVPPQGGTSFGGQGWNPHQRPGPSRQPDMGVGAPPRPSSAWGCEVPATASNPYGSYHPAQQQQQQQQAQPQQQQQQQWSGGRADHGYGRIDDYRSGDSTRGAWDGGSQGRGRDGGGQGWDRGGRPGHL